VSSTIVDAASDGYRARRTLKLLEIWRQAVISACLPCLVRLQLSPSLSPEHTFSWRRLWRQVVKRTAFDQLRCKLSNRLERSAQRNSARRCLPGSVHTLPVGAGCESKHRKCRLQFKMSHLTSGPEFPIPRSRCQASMPASTERSSELG